MIAGLTSKKIVACLGLCLVLAQASVADSAANEHVKVSCDAPGVSVEVNGTQFDVFAPGYPDSFVTNVMVEANGDWDLVMPTESELLRMKGGDTAAYKVTREPEDEAGGAIAFHNYCIKSNIDGGAKYIGVAAGVGVTYTAYKNDGTCPSDWAVVGPDVTEALNNTPNIVFNRSWWQIPDWFISSINTPKPGAYAINAQDVEHAVLKDDGEMAVFGADFVENSGDPENGGHQYGFDDYTNWQSQTGTKEADYYGPKSGRCMWPYASVRENHDGVSDLKIMSFGVNRVFDIVSDTERVNYSPVTTPGSTPISFNVDVALYNFTGEAVLSAEYDGTELAKLRVVPFPLQTRTVLVVYVGTANTVVGVAILNDIYRQCVTEFQVDVKYFPYNDPSNNLWDDADCSAVQTAIMNDANLGASTYEHVVAVLDGRYVSGARGRGYEPGTFCWIWPSRACQYTLAHEIGHNCGLSDKYPKNPVGPGPDKKNLMNMCECGEATGCTRDGHLRYDQWREVN